MEEVEHFRIEVDRLRDENEKLSKDAGKWKKETLRRDKLLRDFEEQHQAIVHLGTYYMVVLTIRK